MNKITVKFSIDETFDEKGFNRLLHRINVFDYLICKCCDDKVIDELYAVKAETTQKVIDILNQINPEDISIYRPDDKSNIIKYKD